MTDERTCPLMKEELKAYYSTPWVREAIYKQCQDRFVCLRFDWGLVRHPTKNERGCSFPAAEGKEFISFASAESKRPNGLQYWIDRGVVEFIPEVSTYHDLDRSDYFIIDLDPKDESFDFNDLRESTVKVLETILKDSWFNDRIKTLNVRFSGNRSFHLYFRMQELFPLKDMREQLKRVIETIENDHLTFHNVRDRKDYILIDIGALARHRCVRSLFSIHAKTGKVCVPIAANEIATFNPETATVANVLAGMFGQVDRDSNVKWAYRQFDIDPAISQEIKDRVSRLVT